MDCAICYGPITPATGKLQLSCSHSFHINCLALWFETLNQTQRTQNCPYCRHESSELEIIPTSSDLYYRLYREMTVIHNQLEGALREEVRVLTENLSLAVNRADLAEYHADLAVNRAAAAEDWVEAAEDDMRKAYDALHDFKVEQRTRDVVAQKLQIKYNWAKWTGSIRK